MHYQGPLPDLPMPGSGAWLQSSESSAPTPLVRHQAQQALPIVNRWHETVELSANEKRWLAGAEVRVDEERLARRGLLV